MFAQRFRPPAFGGDDAERACRVDQDTQIVRAAAPVYLKMGLRNAPNIYPSGAHLGVVPRELGRERVRRAALVQRLRARGFLLLDVQMKTEHTGSMGATEISRKAYLKRLRQAISLTGVGFA